MDENLVGFFFNFHLRDVHLEEFSGMLSMCANMEVHKISGSTNFQ
jgi:hypothetical protein